MPRIEFKWEINMTTAIASLAFLASIVGTYYAVVGDQKLMHQRLDVMQSEYRTMLTREENERKAADVRLEQEVNSNASQLRSELRDMSAKVDRIYEIIVKKQ